MESIKEAVRALYTDLERASIEHGELTDTDVRESLHRTLNYLFVWGKSLPKLPVSYEMFSLAGDKAVSRTVSKFLASALPLVERENIPIGQERLNKLQDESITTPNGESYDLFIGHVDEPLPAEPPPEWCFSPGKYDEY